MDMRELGQRIKNQREKRGLRQSDIADALQISAQAVSKWERGENAPDISILIELSRLLGASVEWLLGATVPSRDTFTATVFCTSLNGFARKAASTPPRDLAAWANGIYFNLTEAMKMFDGIPVKYVGDGSLGFFSGLDHEQRAFDAALQAGKMLDTPDLVIALHTGEIFLGAIGHPDYARPDVLGAAVNTAFLAMPWIAANCASGFGITGATAAGLKNPGLVVKRGAVGILGQPAPVEIFEPETVDDK